VFAAIERYRGAVEAWEELFTYATREEEESEERAAQQDAARDDAFLAWRAWLTTAPTTPAAAIATLKYLRSRWMTNPTTRF
jgi:hypothetical protein